MKFPFEKLNRTSVWERLGNIDLELLGKYLDTKKEGKEMELIVREKISWDTTQMRKFFEGPVCSFVMERYKDVGRVIGKGDVREMLKLRFLGRVEDLGLRVPISTTTLTKPLWIKFLNDINDWCIDTFGCALPEAKNSDIGD